MSGKTIDKVPRTARLICGRGQCFCSYDCGHSNKAPAAAILSLIGKNTVCPLAKYHVEPEEATDFFSCLKDRVTAEDCWLFCAEHCEHSKVDEDGTIHLVDFYDVCIDCPVKAVMDNLSECEAEARMS